MIEFYKVEELKVKEENENQLQNKVAICEIGRFTLPILL